MGLFDIFGKKRAANAEDKKNVENVAKAGEQEATDKEQTAKVSEQSSEDKNAAMADVKNETKEKKKYVPTGSFTLGVENMATISGSDNLVVVGTVYGKIELGMEVYASNFGDDDGRVFSTKVLGIKQGGNPLLEAEKGMVEVLLEDAAERGIKVGTVIHTNNVSTPEVHKSYVNALGNTFVMRKSFEISEAEFENMSITDCAETWSMYAWLKRQNASKAPEGEEEKVKAKVENMGKHLAAKILEADEIYVPFNKLTGEPHLFTHTVVRPDGSFMCTPPEILIISKAYYPNLRSQYSEDKFEIHKIESGDDGEGIKNFLAQAFYINGACAIVVHNRTIGIEASMVVEKPEWENVPEFKIPVTNPDLKRWMLIMAQLGKPNTPEEERDFRIYYRFLSRELVKANLLVPMRYEGEMPTPDALGKAILNKDSKLAFPVMDGKNGRQAILMFTDWIQFSKEFGKDWNGMIQPVSGIIELMDLAINVTEHSEAGAYIDKETYEEMERLAEEQKQ